MKKIPVVAVVGPTASGKTALAVEIAKKFDGEVISADSMQIYEQMDIATAKPTAHEMQGIPHHLIGFQPIDRKFSVADYVRLAAKAVKTVNDAGKLPVLAGGTGLYIDSLLDNIKFSEEERNIETRKELTDLFLQNGAEYMLSELKKADPETAARLHPKDKARIIRALEIYKLTGKTMSEQKIASRAVATPYNALYIGINYRSRSVLYDRINNRVDKMLEAGLLKEAEAFRGINDDTTACQAIGYKELVPYFSGEKSLEECIESLKAETRHYAKRQLTWFRKNERINWLYPDDYADIGELYENAFYMIEDFLRRL